MACSVAACACCSDSWQTAGQHCSQCVSLQRAASCTLQWLLTGCQVTTAVILAGTLRVRTASLPLCEPAEQQSIAPEVLAHALSSMAVESKQTSTAGQIAALAC